MKSIVRMVMLSAAVIAVVLSGCGSDDDNSSGDNGGNSLPINGAWLRSSEYDSDWYLQFKIDGNNWVWSQGPSGNLRGSSKGTWSTNSTISAPSSGTVTLTITHVSPNRDGNWMTLPPEYNNVKVNTVTCELNASANVLTIRDAALTTSGIWDGSEGTYQKQ
jgi:hypothetical protein